MTVVWRQYYSRWRKQLAGPYSQAFDEFSRVSLLSVITWPCDETGKMVADTAAMVMSRGRVDGTDMGVCCFFGIYV